MEILLQFQGDLTILLVMQWFQVDRPAPVLNIPFFREVFGANDGISLPLNSDGHPHNYEFIALPGAIFPVLRSIGEWIIETKDPSYSQSSLYLDKRFGTMHSSKPTQFPKSFPSAETILERMEKRIGTAYVWGGNWANGILETLEYYPPAGELSLNIKTLWTFRGLDCSGLLYEATGGMTPRNTSHLIKYGNPIKGIDKLDSFRPLDMIIYPGHVLFVRDSDTIIESKSPFGVRICPLKMRLEELLSEKKLSMNWPPDENSSGFFTIRRFIKP